MPADVLTVDKHIAKRITDPLGIPRVASEILPLPLKDLGIGDPPISDLIAKLAVNIILRGLNHHLEPFRSMTQITLANWECQDSTCMPPLESDDPSYDNNIGVP